MDRKAFAQRVGQIVGAKYQLLRVLDIGGMGAMYEAEHLLTHRRVALKVVHPWIVAAHSHIANRFIREAEAPSVLKHPAIVEVLDASSEPDELFVVFELLHGE